MMQHSKLYFYAKPAPSENISHRSSGLHIYYEYDGVPTQAFGGLFSQEDADILVWFLNNNKFVFTDYIRVMDDIEDNLIFDTVGDRFVQKLMETATREFNFAIKDKYDEIDQIFCDFEHQYTDYLKSHFIFPLADIVV